LQPDCQKPGQGLLVFGAFIAPPPVQNTDSIASGVDDRGVLGEVAQGEFA
jgi:hypothetical protein